MISHVSQEGKKFTLTNVDKTWIPLNHQNKPSVDAAPELENHNYINKKFLVYLMMRMCMMIFYTFKEMNNVVCVGIFIDTLEEFYMTRYRGLSFENVESST